MQCRFLGFVKVRGKQLRALIKVQVGVLAAGRRWKDHQDVAQYFCKCSPRIGWQG